MIAVDIPGDAEFLAAFGELVLRHANLDHILGMTIKTLADLRPNEALDATAYDGSRQLRERIRKLAHQRLGEGQPLVEAAGASRTLSPGDRSPQRPNAWHFGPGSRWTTDETRKRQQLVISFPPLPI